VVGASDVELSRARAAARRRVLVVLDWGSHEVRRMDPTKREYDFAKLRRVKSHTAGRRRRWTNFSSEVPDYLGVGGGDGAGVAEVDGFLFVGLREEEERS
jgi:hypothetical protein